MLKRKLEANRQLGRFSDELMAWLSSKYSLAQHLKQLRALEAECLSILALAAKSEADADRLTARRSAEFSGTWSAAAQQSFDPRQPSPQRLFPGPGNQRISQSSRA